MSFAITSNTSTGFSIDVTVASVETVVTNLISIGNITELYNISGIIGT